MQAQGGAQQQAQASTSAHIDSTYHAPTPPKIPMSHVQSLVPRLTTTINDIDSFRDLLAQGGQDGSMPNWEVTLQRYSLLLGRITALSKYISQPPPTPAPGQARAPVPPRTTKAALRSYLAHPLNPLPHPGSSSDVNNNVSPFAPDVYFQVLNTLPLPSLSAAQDDLLSGPEWIDKSALKRMNDTELEGLERRLKDRLKREGERAQSLIEEVDNRAAEVDWTMRVNEEEEGDDGSLFGGESDGEDPTAGKGKSGEEAGGPTTNQAKELPQPNPREGWTIQDYVKYMESGIAPTSIPVSTAQSAA